MGRCVTVIITESHMRVMGNAELYKKNLWHSSMYVLGILTSALYFILEKYANHMIDDIADFRSHLLTVIIIIVT